MPPVDYSPVAVTFQCIGTLLLALVMAQIGRIFSWRYARHWAIAWLAMFVAITTVRIYIPMQTRLLWPVYLVAEWTFLVLLISGVRELARLRMPTMRQCQYALPGALVVAAALSGLVDSFNAIFAIQA